MKRTLLLLLLLVMGLSAVAQPENGVYQESSQDEKDRTKEACHFKVDDDRIVWQKVFQSEAPVDQLFAQLSASVPGMKRAGDVFTGHLDNYIPSLGGRKRLACPVILISSKFLANVKVECRDGRYRVTVSNIVIRELSEPAEQFGFELYALQSKKGQIRQNTLHALEILDESFTKTFTLKETKDDW